MMATSVFNEFNHFRLLFHFYNHWVFGSFQKVWKKNIGLKWVNIRNTTPSKEFGNDAMTIKYEAILDSPIFAKFRAFCSLDFGGKPCRYFSSIFKCFFPYRNQIKNSKIMSRTHMSLFCN